MQHRFQLSNKRKSTISKALIMKSDPDEGVKETLSNLSQLHYLLLVLFLTYQLDYELQDLSVKDKTNTNTSQNILEDYMGVYIYIYIYIYKTLLM